VIGLLRDKRNYSLETTQGVCKFRDLSLLIDFGGMMEKFIFLW
jgi:hypothetical protein